MLLNGLLPTVFRNAILLFWITATVVGCSGSEQCQDCESPTPPTAFLVHFYHPLGDYEQVQLNVSGSLVEQESGTTLAPSGTDEFGLLFRLELAHSPQSLTLSLMRAGEQEPGSPYVVAGAEPGGSAYVFSGHDLAYLESPAIPETDQAIIYYVRPDGDYDGWGLHVWQDVVTEPQWTSPYPIAGTDTFGAYWRVDLTPAADQIGFIIHKGDTKDPGPDQLMTFASTGYRIWRLQDDATLYTHPVSSEPDLKIDGARAHLLTRDTLAFDVSGDASFLTGETIELRTDPVGNIVASDNQISGGQSILLTHNPAGLSEALRAQYPHLSEYESFSVSETDVQKMPEILKGQIVAIHSDSNGDPLSATGVQIPGVLDDLYGYDGALGPTWSEGIPTLSVWAPTARSVALLLYEDETSAGTLIPMSVTNGVWSATGDPSWNGRYYQFQVEVYVPATGTIETNLVTDPYSISLSSDSQRSWLANLDDMSLKPASWDEHSSPFRQKPEDAVLYELHLRDFSISDLTVPEPHRGTFLAFTDLESDGMRHLQSLASAGLTHVHLLPIFDIATVREDRSDQTSPGDLTAYGPDSEEQQAAVMAGADSDGFNWGYDPWHYSAPEGSYATDANGGARVLEFRAMVQALHQVNLSVIMDVVYNHTNASGQGEKSVLDRIVPGYYHRLNASGQVETSTCCQNTATEHRMMEKLMIDSILRWARDYRVDGFRFDLMGHHMKSNLENVRDALWELAGEPAEEGGTPFTLYGEGWNFGEVANNQRGVNATQLNMAGTGIGTFNDRLRDAVRGGGPFDSGEALQKQGFINGLYTSPNDYDQGSEEAQKAALLKAADLIRIGLTGNLKNYTFENAAGEEVSGFELDYNGAPAGYTLDPQEAITYCSAHDNQTLFDINQYKAPTDTTSADRVRMHNLGISLVALGQGVPFFHAGVELLRSKSMDRDSYNSGDWFNRIDFTFQTNNWAVGLPVEDVNGSNWPLIQPMLTDPARRPSPEDIIRTADHFREILEIRRSSQLFRLGTEEAVRGGLTFFNTGPDQVAGVIGMRLEWPEGWNSDGMDPFARIVVIFNATPDEVSITVPELESNELTLHPVFRDSTDGRVPEAMFLLGEFMVPALTTAVFVETVPR